MNNINFLEFMVVCGSMLLLILLLTEVLDWSQLFPWMETECPTANFTFGYMSKNGPHTWKTLYPESNGCNQSPINITTRLAVVVQLSDPLLWCGYNEEPSSITLTNDKNTVVMSTNWGTKSRPSIKGGCLNGEYDLHSMMFHWGHSSTEGSEHTLDYTRYPMELQVCHIKRGLHSTLEAIISEANDGIAIVTFFFEITNADNPYLDQIVTNLWRIAQPGMKVNIPSFPLEWIFPPFEDHYYSYNGSLTQPPCSEIVTWIIRPEPIAVSSSQVEQFRKICSIDGPVLSNSRPVQRLNERDVYFYE